jgi:hypothetical protein
MLTAVCVDCAAAAGAAAVTPTHPVLKIVTAKTKMKTREKTKDLTMERDIRPHSVARFEA